MQKEMPSARPLRALLAATAATVAALLPATAAAADEPAVADGVEPARDVLAAQVVNQPEVAPLPARRLTNQVTVALVAPQGARKDGVTLQEVVGTVDGPVAEFWAGQSDG